MPYLLRDTGRGSRRGSLWPLRVRGVLYSHSHQVHIDMFVSAVSSLPSLGICPVCRKDMRSEQLLRYVKEAVPASEPSAAMDFSTVLAKQWKTSTKVDALLREVCAMLAEDPTNKCIVFSQWTTMLDLLQVRVDAICVYVSVSLGGVWVCV